MLYCTAPLTDPSPSTQVPPDIPILCTKYMKYMNTTNTTDDAMNTKNTTDDTMSHTTNTTDNTIKAHCSGALGLYRITLWIIVLTLALLSMIVCI